MGKYLEGNYDSDNLAISNRQRMNDELEAWQIEREAQKYQETAKEIEAKRILGEEQVSDAEIEKVFQEYAEEDKWRQYLVNGAVLTCNQATWKPFKVPGQENIVLEQNHIADKYTFPVGVLKVFDDEMVINGELYATVKDAVLGKNIFPFRCKCKRAADRKDELTKIKKDPNCNKHGVCRHLMKLNEEWENLPLGKHLYKTKGAGINGEVENVKKEEIECITMTSMLFCKHGGLITPVTSGQYRNIKDVYALACTTGGSHDDELKWEQMKVNAEYIYEYFQAQGWTTEAICGLLGNIYEESRMNPGAWQDWKNINQGYGLVQWTEGSYYIIDYAGLDVNGVNDLAMHNPQQLMTNELQFLEESLQPNNENNRWYTANVQVYYDKLPLSVGVSGVMTSEEYSQSDYEPRDMALIFHACYERSADDTEKLKERANAAEQWYKHFTGECEISKKDFSL